MTTDPRELTTPELLEFEEEVRRKVRARGPMTREEWREQRINSVWGEIGERCGLSREEVVEILDRS